YHGSPESFTEFAFTDDLGFHFGTENAARTALSYFNSESGEVRPFYLSIKNPIRARHDAGTWDVLNDAIKALPLTEQQLEALDEKFERDGESHDSLREFLIEQGYDGVVYQNAFEGGESWIAFRPEQIKSATGNRGTFDPNDPNILNQDEAPGVVTRLLQRAIDLIAPPDAVTDGSGVAAVRGRAYTVDGEPVIADPDTPRGVAIRSLAEPRRFPLDLVLDTFERGG